jgi:hypothetical protein
MTERGPEIALAELRNALERLRVSASEQFGPSVDLDADQYWWIETDEAFDLTREPSVVAGGLSDDVSSMREMMNREVVLWHDLDHVIGILQRISSLSRP